MKMNVNSDDMRGLRQAKAFIEKDLKSHITIPELANMVGLNDYKLKHGFKQAFGIPVHAYRLQLRVKHAQALLSDKNKPVKSIALHTGFRSPSAFSRAFKAVTGLSPSAWRRQQKKSRFV